MGMQHYPTLRQFQYLEALHRTGSFRKAAEACHVTQPTLSAGIQEMENLIGLPLLDRSNHKKLIFTDIGKQVLKTGQQIFPHLDALMGQATAMAKPLSGRFRLGIIPTIAPYVLPHILPVFKKSFPAMQFEITEGMTATLLHALQEGDIDMALMAFPYETPNLSQEIFFKEPFLCAAPQKSFTKKSIKREDLKNQTVLLLEDGHCLRDHALAACALLEPQPNDNPLKATSLQTLIHTVAQGYGITLLPQMMVKNTTLPRNISLIPFQNPAPSRQIGVAWRPKDPLLPNIQAVTETLKKSLKDII